MVCENKFNIEEEITNPSSIILNKVYPKSWKGTNKLLTDYYFPQDYSKCIIFKDDDLIFTGIVKNSADMNLNPFKPHYCSLQILDPSTLLSEGKVLDYVIANKTVEEAINQVIDSISDYGFIAGNINIPDKYNTVIGAYSTLDKAPFDVFQYLSQISLTRWGTRMIDEDTTAIDFFDPEELEDGEPIMSTKEYFQQNKICDLNYDYSTTDYRNKQIITSDEVFGNVEQNQILISNGYDTTYTIEQKIGKINSITVNGVPATFATNEEKEYDVEADFYYTILENQISSAEIYSVGTQIQINYIPIVKGREVSSNNSELGRIYANLGRNGAITRYENRNDVTDSKELQTVGQSYIKFKGIPEITLTLTSRRDFLNLGEKHYFDAPLQELKGDYLIKAKTTSVLQNGDFSEIVYTYKLTNSFDTENEINYFDNQRAKKNGNIAQGEYITRNIDIENTANIIFSNLSVTEITVDGDNVLDSVLDSPFTQ